MIIKKSKHRSDSMCQLPPKKPNIEKKKPKSQTTFWRQLPLKRAKFVKFGVKKANLATLFKDKVHARCCHWLDINVAFTTKITAWHPAQGPRRPLVASINEKRKTWRIRQLRIRSQIALAYRNTLIAWKRILLGLLHKMFTYASRLIFFSLSEVDLREAKTLASLTKRLRVTSVHISWLSLWNCQKWSIEVHLICTQVVTPSH